MPTFLKGVAVDENTTFGYIYYYITCMFIATLIIQIFPAGLLPPSVRKWHNLRRQPYTIMAVTVLALLHYGHVQKSLISILPNLIEISVRTT